MSQVFEALSKLVAIELMQDSAAQQNAIIEFNEIYGEVSAFVNIARVLKDPAYSLVAEMFCYDDCLDVLRSIVRVSQELATHKDSRLPSVISAKYVLLVHENLERIEADLERLAEGLDRCYIGVIAQALEHVCGTKIVYELGIGD